MGTEIERKWIVKPTQELVDYMVETGGVKINDYYFNQFTRLRKYDSEYRVTIKSEGNLIRDEFEFPIEKATLNFIPNPTLEKKRIFYPYKGHTFEINIFKDILFSWEDTNQELILMELELSDKDELFSLPDFAWKEVTYNEMYYGWNLFKSIQKMKKFIVHEPKNF